MAGVVAVAATALLAVAGPGPVRAVRSLSSPAAGVTADALLTDAVAAGGWAVAVWLCTGVLLTALARLPGAAGRACAALARHVTPALVRRAVGAALGAALTTGAVGGTAGPALARGAQGPSAPVAPASTAVSPGPGTVAGVPDLDRPSAPAQVPVLPDLDRPSSPPQRDVAPAAVTATPPPEPDRLGAGSGDAPTPWPADPSRSSARPTDADVRPAAPVPAAEPSPTPSGASHPPGVASAAAAPLPDLDRPASDVAGLDPVVGRDRRRTDDVVVVRGDSLWAIARRHLPAGASDGEVSAAWRRWWQVNRSVVGPDPDVLRPGQVLRPPQDV